MELLAECRRLAAMSLAEREARQQQLAMDAVDLALLDGVAVTTSHFLRGSAAARASRREEALIQANRNLTRLLHTITHEQLDQFQNLGKPKPANDGGAPPNKPPPNKPPPAKRGPKNRRPHGRPRLPAHLPRVTTVHRIADEARTCP